MWFIFTLTHCVIALRKGGVEEIGCVSRTSQGEDEHYDTKHPMIFFSDWSWFSQFFVLNAISVWLMNEWLLEHVWFWFLLAILTLLQTGSVYHLIWFLVSKFYLGKSYTQDTQEDMMPTSEEGMCEILLSQTFFISTLASKFAAVMVVYRDSSSRDQSLRIWFSFWKVQTHRNVVLLHPFQEWHSWNIEYGGTYIHKSKFVTISLSHIPPESSI